MKRNVEKGERLSNLISRIETKKSIIIKLLKCTLFGMFEKCYGNISLKQKTSPLRIEWKGNRTATWIKHLNFFLFPPCLRPVPHEDSCAVRLKERKSLPNPFKLRLGDARLLVLRSCKKDERKNSQIVLKNMKLGLVSIVIYRD